MRRLSAIALALAVLASCGGGDAPADAPADAPGTGSPSPDPLFGRGTVVIDTGEGEVRLDVEIAETEEARERGLMGREHLPEDAGMVFLFEEPAPVGFWMKDTLIPLSIAFWDPDGRIVAIEEMEPCTEEPCPVTYAPEPVIGALEANAGYFERNGVEVGDRIELRRD